MTILVTLNVTKEREAICFSLMLNQMSLSAVDKEAKTPDSLEPSGVLVFVAKMISTISFQPIFGTQSSKSISEAADFFFLPRREAVAKAATPNPRPANWLLAVPVFGSFLPFERPGPAGCCAGACEWFNALEIEALSDKLAEVLTLSLKLVLVETDSLVLIEALTLLLKLAEVEASPEPLLVLVEPEPLPELLLALIEAD